MAQTSIHIESVKTGSEQHNKREKTLDYVRAELSKNNSYWESDTQKHRLADIKTRYKTSTGQQLQKKATPIREAVVVIKQDTTMNDLQNLAQVLEQRFGIKCFQIAIHKDEGHVAAKEWKQNLHAHLVFDFTDESGKSLKLRRHDLCAMQTLVAECLGMERGVSSSRSHLSAVAYKVAAKEQELDKLSVATATKEATIETIRGIGAAVTDVVTNRRKKARKEVIDEIIKKSGFKVKEGEELTPSGIGKSWRAEYDKAKGRTTAEQERDTARNDAAEKQAKAVKLDAELKKARDRAEKAEKALREAENAKNGAIRERDAARKEAENARADVEKSKNALKEMIAAVATILQVTVDEAMRLLTEIFEKRGKEIKRESEKSFAHLDENLELIEPEEQERERSRGFHL